MTIDSSVPNQEQAGQPQYRVCPKCGARNLPGFNYCMGCGEFLPPPVGQTQYGLGVPQEQKKGLSVPVILLIISIVLLAAMGALFLLLVAV